MPTTSGPNTLSPAEQSGVQLNGKSGSVPGQAVTLLPEEGRAVNKAAPNVVLTNTIPDAGENSSNGDGNVENPKNVTERMVLSDEKKKFPSIKGITGDSQRHGGVGGIGTLSWAGSETSIAKLPEERIESNLELKSGARGNAKVKF